MIGPQKNTGSLLKGLLTVKNANGEVSATRIGVVTGAIVMGAIGIAAAVLFGFFPALVAVILPAVLIPFGLPIALGLIAVGAVMLTAKGIIDFRKSSGQNSSNQASPPQDSLATEPRPEAPEVVVEASRDEEREGEVSNGEALEGRAPEDKAPEDKALKDGALNGGVPEGELSEAEVPENEVLKDEALNGEALKNEVPEVKLLENEALEVAEAPKDKASENEVLNDEAPEEAEMFELEGPNLFIPEKEFSDAEEKSVFGVGFPAPLEPSDQEDAPIDEAWLEVALKKVPELETVLKLLPELGLMLGLELELELRPEINAYIQPGSGSMSKLEMTSALRAILNAVSELIVRLMSDLKATLELGSELAPELVPESVPVLKEEMVVAATATIKTMLNLVFRTKSGEELVLAPVSAATSEENQGKSGT